MTPQIREFPADAVIANGSHSSFEAGACAVEWANYLAGKPHSDGSEDHISEPLRAFAIGWNDALPSDADRHRLLGGIIPRLIDSRSTPAVEEYRAFLAFDWLVRIYTPAWLDLLPACAPNAAALRALAPICDLATAKASEPVASAAESAAWSAAWSAAESAAGSAAWSAAGSAARSAAGSAAGSAAWRAAGSAAGSAARRAAGSAAWSAAGSAAESAAGSAAWSAARRAAGSAAESAAGSAAWSAAESAAGSALTPTRDQVQLLALDLVDRMLAVTPETLPVGWVPPSQVQPRVPVED